MILKTLALSVYALALMVTLMLMSGCVTGQMGGQSRIDVVSLEVGGSVGGSLYVKGEPARFTGWLVDGGKWLWNGTAGRAANWLIIGTPATAPAPAAKVEPEKPIVIPIVSDPALGRGENNKNSLTTGVRGTVTTGPEK